MDVIVPIILIVVVGIISAAATVSIKNSEIRKMEKRHAIKIANMFESHKDKIIGMSENCVADMNEMAKRYEDNMNKFAERYAVLNKCVYELVHDTKNHEKEMDIEELENQDLEKAFKDRVK